MRFRLLAFGLHLASSAALLTIVLGAFWLGWYRWPGWYLSSVLHVVAILAMVDVALGPTLTLIVANPGKPRRELARDVAVIVTVQLAALVYGGITLWGGRPLYYTFSADRLELVQASDLKADDIRIARRENPGLAPYWYSRPRWIWAPLPDDPAEAERIVAGTITGGADVVQMPRYFRPWAQGLPALRQKLARLDGLKYFNRAEKQALEARLRRSGIPADQPDTLVMWGGTRRVLAVFDLRTLRVVALLSAD